MAQYRSRMENERFRLFYSDVYLDINIARLEHLDTLALPLEKKSVLEVGGGIGMLSFFFEEKKCTVISTEARQENIEENIRLHPTRKSTIFSKDLSIPHSHDDLGSFEIVFCYGTLYHLPNPHIAIKDLARCTQDILLIETMVSKEDNGKVNQAKEDLSVLDQAFTQSGCRPARNWIFSELKKYFPYVYCTATQPKHKEFPTCWPVPADSHTCARSIFLGSRKKLHSQLLLSSLPAIQYV